MAACLPVGTNRVNRVTPRTQMNPFEVRYLSISCKRVDVELALATTR